MMSSFACAHAMTLHIRLLPECATYSVSNEDFQVLNEGVRCVHTPWLVSFFFIA
jgi:hypothetical protein